MSWDVILVKTETNQEATPDEIEKKVPITTKTEVNAWLRQNYPEETGSSETDEPDTNEPVVIFGENYTVELVLDEGEEQSEIMLAVHGSEAPYDLIESMCRAFNCRAIDTGTGGFLEGPETSSFGGWEDSRNEVEAEYEAREESWFRKVIGWFSGK